MVYGRGAECSLCERAIELVQRLAREFELAVESVDVSTDAALFERYQFVIPVVVFDGVELGSGRLRGD